MARAVMAITSMGSSKFTLARSKSRFRTIANPEGGAYQACA